MRPGPVLLVAIVLLAWSIAEAARSDRPIIAPMEAAHYDGQEVVVEGLLRQVRVDEDTRATIMADGFELDVRLAGIGHPDGVFAHVPGRLARHMGELVLFADSVEVVAAIPTTLAWSALAADPSYWVDRPVQLGGVVRDGALRADGHALRLGDGPWPDAGHVEAQGTLAFDAGCLCLRFDAWVVRWT